MKFFLLIGGGCGFLLAFIGGLLAGKEILIVVRDGTIGCIVGALLMKGFAAIYFMSVKCLAVERANERLKRNQASSN